jgi:hypothetical protein
MKTIYSCNLTGTKMGQLGRVKDQITVGTTLNIIRRPDNAYDGQAMSVHFGDELLGVTNPQIGWIPVKEVEDKIVKSVLFNLMSHGIDLYAVVTHYDAESRAVRVDVCLHDDKDFSGVTDSEGLEAEADEDDIPGTGDND